MLGQVNQLGQGALSFPEKKLETTLFLGKRKQVILKWTLSRLLFTCYPSIEHNHKLCCIRVGCI